MCSGKYKVILEVLSMNSTLAQAKYIIALQNSNVSDDIRKYYKDDNTSRKDYWNIFSTIISTELRKVKDVIGYTVESAKGSIENEFNAFALNEMLGDYEAYSAFVDIVFSTRKSDLIDDCKFLVDFATTQDDEIKAGVYLSVLRRLVNSGKLLDDKVMTETVMSYLDTQDDSSVISIIVGLLIDSRIMD